MKRALVLGAGGFIGHHFVMDLVSRGYFVRGVDLKRPSVGESPAGEFVLSDLKVAQNVRDLFDRPFDEVYQFAANMGGAGFIFTGQNDAEILYDNAIINLNTVNAFKSSGSAKLFFSSSACVYPRHTQASVESLNCSEEVAYPADPDSEYGWEKLFGERLFLAYRRNEGLDIKVGRFHNIYGELCTWTGGREKAPAAICRKIALALEGGSIELWGDGDQTRSFLYISDCLSAVRKLMHSSFSGPYNIGSEEMVSIEGLARLLIEVSGKTLDLTFVDGPQGVRSRNSNNALINRDLGWRPSVTLRDGMRRLYEWVEGEVASSRESPSIRRETVRYSGNATLVEGNA